MRLNMRNLEAMENSIGRIVQENITINNLE